MAGEKKIEEKQPKEKSTKFVPDQHSKALYTILKYMLSNEEYATLDFELDLGEDEFLTKSFAYVNKCKAEGKKSVPSILYNIFEDKYDKYKENIEYLQDIVSTTTIENKQSFEDCAKLVQKNQIQKQIDRLTKQSKEEPDQEKQRLIWGQIAKLGLQLKEINKR